MTPTQAGTTLALLFTLGAGAALLGTGAQADSPEAPAPKTPAQRKSATKKSAAKDAVRWNQDLKSAREWAAKLDQPLLVFQLLGDLDQEFC